MKKTISLFKRDYEGTRLIYDEVVPGAEWVLAGEGIATRKYDGTCCLYRGGRFYKRYELREGKKAPPGFEPATDVDSVTKKQQGWVPVGDGPEDRWHREAADVFSTNLDELTMELVGPKVQGNPENFESHQFIPHRFAEVLEDCPRDFNGIRDYLAEHDIEGIVWHHPDGRWVKIKGKDFGLKRGKR